MNYYNDAIDMIIQLKKDYDFLVDEKISIFNELYYIKQAISSLGLDEQIKNKINEIKEIELPF